MNQSTDDTVALRRRLTLPLLVLYGTGVTVGAGIYVLIGSVAAHARGHAPLAFVAAAVVMGLTVGSYAELSRRFPVAAGEAAYVKAAFGSRLLSTIVGVLTIVIGVIASAAVAHGAAGYIEQFVAWPRSVSVVIVVVALGLVAAYGILESVLLASVFTLVEVGGLAAIIAAAVQARLPIGAALFALPPLEAGPWLGIAFASLLAFFAFIGFEDLANAAEEAKNPERDLPIAMALTLAITTILYVVIAAIAVTALPVDRLAESSAPLSLVYREVAGVSPTTISIIAIVATLNTIIAQMTMATRVVYGMAKGGDLPRLLARVNGATATPLVATATIVAAVLGFALLLPFEQLAELTSLATLVVLALVNLAQHRLRRRGEIAPAPGRFQVPLAVPALGFLTCLAMIAISFI